MQSLENVNRNNPFVIVLDDLLKERNLMILSFAKLLVLTIFLNTLCIITCIAEFIIDKNYTFFIMPIIVLPFILYAIFEFKKILNDNEVKVAYDMIYGKKMKTMNVNEEKILRAIKFINRSIGVLINITKYVKLYIVILVAQILTITLFIII